MYDFLIVGCGLAGAVMANRIKDAGYSCLIIERRPHLAGNAFTEKIEDIQVHKYGPHIFHTNSEAVWEYVNRFASFNRYTNSPLASYRGEIYNLPFNMNTFHKMWGVITPQQAQMEIARQCDAFRTDNPQNLKEQALSLVGQDIYDKLIRGYTEKQWGRRCEFLPPSIIKRIPLRFTYDNNYFDDAYQGIPMYGYTSMVEKMISGVDVEIETDFLANRTVWSGVARVIIYTGAIDEYFNCRFGKLQYRSLRFETELLDIPNYQGNAVINYTDCDIPFTRVIEHKHFLFGNQKSTVISREYSVEYDSNNEPYYPINDDANNRLYQRYRRHAENEKGVYFIGRLGEYQYFNMDQVILSAMEKSTADRLSAMLEHGRID